MEIERIEVTVGASAAYFTDDGYRTALGFADDPNNPVSYIVLQFTNVPNEQDRAFGLDGVHIDAGALNIVGYGLVQCLCNTGSGVVVKLTADAARKAGIGQDIAIELGSKALAGISVRGAVQRFRERLRQEKASALQM